MVYKDLSRQAKLEWIKASLTAIDIKYFKFMDIIGINESECMNNIESVRRQIAYWKGRLRQL